MFEATFRAQKVGYRCNYRNWVQNWDDLSLKCWARKSPISANFLVNFPLCWCTAPERTKISPI